MNEPSKKIAIFKSVIGLRFILYIALFSSAIIILSTGLQLYWNFDHELKSIRKVFIQIENSYLESIIDSLWVTDDKLLQIQLEGILRLPNVRFVEIRNGAEVLEKVGTPQLKGFLEKTTPLTYFYNGRDNPLGDLHVVVSLKEVYTQIFSQFGRILINQAIIIFFVSIFIIILFYQLVGRHIIHMASYVDSVSFDSFDQPLLLNRKPTIKKPDELDKLAASFNHMRKNLKKFIFELSLTEGELRKIKSNLEIIVDERTGELQKKIVELERFQDAVVDRELRIKELREKIKELESRLDKKS
jgi:methyl-accepting chemotaxis protein